MLHVPPARRKLLEAITALGEPSTSKQLVDWIATQHGHGLKRPTVSTQLNALLKDGLADPIERPGYETLWTLPQGVSGVMTTPTRQLMTGDSDDVVTVAAYKATVTPDTPDDTLEETPGTDEKPDLDEAAALIEREFEAAILGADEGRCARCGRPYRAWILAKRDGRCVRCFHDNVGAA